MNWGYIMTVAELFKMIHIESKRQLDGLYTLRLEFGKESREFPNLTRHQLQVLADGVMQAPIDEDIDFIYMEHIKGDARKNDNTGVS